MIFISIEMDVLKSLVVWASHYLCHVPIIALVIMRKLVEYLTANVFKGARMIY